MHKQPYFGALIVTTHHRPDPKRGGAVGTTVIADRSCVLPVVINNITDAWWSVR